MKLVLLEQLLPKGEPVIYTVSAQLMFLGIRGEQSDRYVDQMC